MFQVIFYLKKLDVLFNGGLTYDIIDIHIGLDRDNLSSSNLKLAFNQKPMCPVANITINATE